MRTAATIKLNDMAISTIQLGFVGESNHNKIVFDCEAVFSENPSAVQSITVTPPVGDPYPVVSARVGNNVEWIVGDSDVAVEGDGKVQLTFVENNETIKSYEANTTIMVSSIPGQEPTAIADWITAANATLEEVDEAIPTGGTKGQVLAKASNADRDTEWVSYSGSYNDMSDKPQIEGVTLSGDVSLQDLGAAAAEDIPDVSGFYTKPESGIPASDLATGVIPDVSGFYSKPQTGIPATDIADGVIPDVSGFYTKPSTGIPASDLATGVIPDVSGYYTKPTEGIPDTDMSTGVRTSLGKADSAYQKPGTGIPAGDLASGVIPDVSGFYTKPSGGIPDTDLSSGVQTSLGKADSAYQKPGSGIPASDLATGVIPDPTEIIDDTAGDGDTDLTWSADKIKEETDELKEAIENVEGQIAVVQTFTSDEVVNGIYSSTTGNINTDYKYGLSNSVPIYIGSNGKAKIKCNGYYIRAFRFPAEGVTGFTYTDYTADEVTLSGTSTLVRVAFTVRKDPSVSTALTSSEIADILSKLSVEKNMSAVIEDVEKEIGTIIGMKSVVPEKWVNAIYSSTTGRINYQYKYAISNEIKIPIRQNAVVRCPGYYIRAFRFSADSTSFDYIGYVADEVTLDPTSTLKYLGFSIRINPNSSTALTEEQIADIKSKVSVQILTTTTDDDLTEIGIPADAYFVGKALSNSAKNNCIIGRPSVYHSTNPTAVSFDETDYTDVYDAYDSLCVAYPKWIQKQTDIGTDADSNPICLYKLRLFNPIVGKVDPWSYNDGEKVNYWQDTFKYRRALLTSGAHGNEKCAVWGLLYFITDLLASSDEWASFIKGNYELDIIPVIDPWGYNNNSRNNKNDVNINRDYLSPTQPETQAVVDYIQSVKDEIFCSIDCHGTSGNYGYVSARQENPAFGEIMRVANAMFGATADDVATVATSMSISSDYYPYSYGCMSENEGTLHHYLYVNGVTEYAVTLEAPNKTGTNGGLATKYINEGLGNLLQGFLSIFKIV